MHNSIAVELVHVILSGPLHKRILGELMSLFLAVCNEMCPQPFSNTYHHDDGNVEQIIAMQILDFLRKLSMHMKILEMPGKLGHRAMNFSGKPHQNPRKSHHTVRSLIVTCR